MTHSTPVIRMSKFKVLFYNFNLYLSSYLSNCPPFLLLFALIFLLALLLHCILYIIFFFLLSAWRRLLGNFESSERIGQREKTCIPIYCTVFQTFPNSYWPSHWSSTGSLWRWRFGCKLLLPPFFVCLYRELFCSTLGFSISRYVNKLSKIFLVSPKTSKGTLIALLTS